ncbi:MAG: hypothetical protein HQK58_02700 [Deltaproteobacteria bacterium]|nr:hypothetical protein [Deltaproteobacteria bacterium]
MDNERTLCAVCAWRGDCKKKFSFEGSGQRFCADYAYDQALKGSPPDRSDHLKDPVNNGKKI